MAMLSMVSLRYVLGPAVRWGGNTPVLLIPTCTPLGYSWPGPLLQLVRTIVTVGQDHCYSWSKPLLQLVRTIVTVGQDHCYSWSGPLLQLVRTIVRTMVRTIVTVGQDHCYSWSGPLLQLVRTIVTVGQDHVCLV